jgi:galactokinase
MTYDNEGDVIPLSDRFNAENEDIRYSLRDAEVEKAAEAVRKENKKLKEDVQRLRDLLKLQRQVTGGTKFTASSVETAARYLKQTGNIKGNTGEFGKLLNDFYEAIAQDRELSWENVQEYAQPVVTWMMDHRTGHRKVIKENDKCPQL